MHRTGSLLAEGHPWRWHSFAVLAGLPRVDL